MGNSQIVKKCIPYNPQTERFLLCLNEKLETAAYKKHNLLNQKKQFRNQLEYAPPRSDTKDWYDNRLIETTILQFFRLHLQILFSWLKDCAKHGTLSTNKNIIFAVDWALKSLDKEEHGWN